MGWVGVNAALYILSTKAAVGRVGHPKDTAALQLKPFTQALVFKPETEDAC